MNEVPPEITNEFLNTNNIPSELIGYSKVFVQVIHNLIIAAKSIVGDPKKIQVNMQEQKDNSNKKSLLYVEVKLASVNMMSITQKNAYEEISRETEIWKILKQTGENYSNTTSSHEVQNANIFCFLIFHCQELSRFS